LAFEAHARKLGQLIPTLTFFRGVAFSTLPSH
jgi:hypothetical protein